MAEFIKIETQEEFDERIKERLERQKRTVEEKMKNDFAAQLSELETLRESKKQWETSEAAYKKKAEENEGSIASLTSQLAEEQKKVKGYQRNEMRSKIASETGLPVTLAGRIQGETEDEMREDAKALAGVFKANNNKGLPMANLDDKGGSEEETKEELKSLLGQVRKGE